MVILFWVLFLCWCTGVSSFWTFVVVALFGYFVTFWLLFLVLVMVWSSLLLLSFFKFFQEHFFILLLNFPPCSVKIFLWSSPLPFFMKLLFGIAYAGAGLRQGVQYMRFPLSSHCFLLLDDVTNTRGCSSFRHIFGFSSAMTVCHGEKTHLNRCVDNIIERATHRYHFAKATQ